MTAGTRVSEFDSTVLDPLDLHPEAFVVGDQEAEIPNLQAIYAGVIHLINDTSPDSDPDTRRPQRGTHRLLVATAPVGRHTGCTRRFCLHIIKLIKHATAVQWQSRRGCDPVVGNVAAGNAVYSSIAQ